MCFSAPASFTSSVVLIVIGIATVWRAHSLTPATYSFLIFAQVVWPTWVPLSFLVMAERGRNRIELSMLTGIGLLVSLYLGICLWHYGTFAEAHTRHVVYNLHYPPHITVIVGALYGVVTISSQCGATSRP